MIYCYHHNDVDGITAGAMVNLRFPEENKRFIELTYPVNGKNILEDLRLRVGINKIFFVDIAFGDEDKEFLTSLSKLCHDENIEIIWIDHHEMSKQFRDNWNDIPYNIDAEIDTSACGALLTYNYLHKNDNMSTKIPAFLKLVDAWDRHLIKSSTWKVAVHFQYGITSEKGLNPQSEVYTELLSSPYRAAEIADKGKIIWDYIDETNRKLISKDGVVVKVNGLECLALNYHGTSMVFDSVRDKFPLCMQWHYDGKLYHYSIYTDSEDINCNLIAKAYGGGGHPGAAGFSSTKLLFLN